ncbi:MAG: phosphoribosylamine--glycine ligase [Robiginitomaculum sp.]|nr:MAG: phosphoribosylamine--glycine ligase [Robiginitomaculum sp.]
MKILLIGGGGREHSLAWKIIQSPLCDQLICTPGNAGIAEIADCANIAVNDVAGIIALVQDENIDFVIVGPEAPLELGLVDKLTALGIASFGPTEKAAQLETSKGFTKDFCTRHTIPTARYDVFTELGDAKAYLDEMTAPYVIKADGLAAGKGVVIAETKEIALSELDEFFSGKFGDAGTCVVIEEFMYGHEISFFALSDGKMAMPLIEAQDHKRAYDGDKGPNTGGMGAYSPVPGFDQAMVNTIMADIINPTVHGMAKENMPFVGVLFAGLMMTDEGPKLIEYNARFGDPECQLLMRRLKSDIVEILLAASLGSLDKSASPEWDETPVANVVLAAKGYPNAYAKGTVIKGVDAANLMEGVQVFHAGTQRNEAGALVAAGGRVLNVTATGKDIDQAVKRAYSAIDDAIDWPDGFCRRDIAKQALKNM